MATPTRNPTPTSVYRYYDAFGVLIYVGITSTGMLRNRQHNSDKEWWKWVAEQKVDHFPSRAEAQGHEKALIQKFRPPFNKVHNHEHEPIKAAYIALRQTSSEDVSIITRGHIPIEQRRFRVGVAEAHWDTGHALVRVSPDQTPAAPLIRPWNQSQVFEHTDLRGKKIGNVSDVMAIGPIAILKLKIRPGVTFQNVEVWIKQEAKHFVVKQVAALDCVWQ